MLKPKRRLTKRQIKEDKFVTYYYKTQDYLSENRKSILTGLGIVAAIVIATFIFTQKQQQKEQSAVVELAKAKSEYFSGNYQQAVPLLQNIVQSYGGTDSGVQGLYYLANSNFFLEKYDEAITNFEKFLDESDDGLLAPAALAGMAASLEGKGEYEAAAEKYKEAAERYEESFTVPENLYDAARCFSLAGNTESARTTLSKLIEEHGNSTLKTDAEIMLAELKFNKSQSM